MQRKARGFGVERNGIGSLQLIAEGREGRIVNNRQVFVRRRSDRGKRAHLPRSAPLRMPPEESGLDITPQRVEMQLSHYSLHRGDIHRPGLIIPQIRRYWGIRADSHKLPGQRQLLGIRIDSLA